MMNDARDTYLARCSIYRLLRFTYSKDFFVRRFTSALTAHSFKQRASIWNQRHSAYRPVLRSSLGIAANHNFARFKVHITPFDLSSFSFAAAGECQPTQEVGTVS